MPLHAAQLLRVHALMQDCREEVYPGGVREEVPGWCILAIPPAIYTTLVHPVVSLSIDRPVSTVG